MTNGTWLNDQESQAWKYLVGLLFRLPPVLEGQLQREEDLSFADYMVMAMLSENTNEGVRMTDIGGLVKMAQPRLTRIVTKLEKLGFVTRTNSPEDRRVVIAQITPQGLSKLEQAAPGHVDHVRRTVFDHLTPQQVENLLEIGQALLDSGDPELSMQSHCANSPVAP